MIDQGDPLRSALTPWLGRKAQTDGSMPDQGRPVGEGSAFRNSKIALDNVTPIE
jgi:hypothetical protein